MSARPDIKLYAFDLGQYNYTQWALQFYARVRPAGT
jgi:hypothetical protein